uniref:Retrovirus-related Pol polyprotein from transposon TNT 1-94-like beta-barrel domain-containing protein n=1 Tax=Tanacetum cinerariifolium TaxID=118510 RepID=A0A699II44_TANCI|nr:hypothetical protein [Tanacetum cinerariifolium]
MVKSITLRAKKESSDDETLTSRSDDEEYDIRDFKKFFRKKVCLRIGLKPDEWIKDSGCSKHMTENKSLFSTDKAYNEEHVDNLAFSLLIVGQICDNKCRVLFTEYGSERTKDRKVPQDYDVSSVMPRLLIHVIYAISLSLYPFTECYAQPYFFSCLIRQTFLDFPYWFWIVECWWKSPTSYYSHMA